MVFPIHGVYFICCITNYMQVIKEQFELLIKCGLYQKTTKLIIFICLCKDDIKEYLTSIDIDNKFVLVTTEDNLYEKFAINNFKAYITDEPYYLYYFHAKGLSHYGDSDSQVYVNRRLILTYYTIIQHEVNIKLLSHFDAVGCALSAYPKTHFSGNFWWSKSKYINTLVDKIGDGYLAPEMYILSRPFGKFISLSQKSNNASLLYYHVQRSEEDIFENATTVPIYNEWDKKYITQC